MAEEPQVIRGINWRETFPFINIFRAFRIAIHPSKLVLALLALLVLYFGGRVLDGFWWHEHRAVPGEIEMYEHSRLSSDFFEQRQAMRAASVDAYAQELMRLNKPEARFQDLKKPDVAHAAAEEGKYPNHVRYAILQEQDAQLRAVQDRYVADIQRIDKETKADDQSKMMAEEQKRSARRDRDRQVAGIRSEFGRRLELVRNVEGKGLFLAFFQYQTQKIDTIVRGVLSGNWLGGLDPYMRNNREAGGEPEGVMVSTIKFFTVAPAWALRHHPVYFVLFGALFLVVWSLFGGAIARIAAVHVADEGRKLSVRQGLSFAVSKFLSFISAPMIPLIIVIGIGLVVAIAGVLTNIPWLGPVIVGALFFLALAAGFVMTLVLIGTAGGFNLMYPTIAVEGSDSFDAISRSFSYVYAKPWRMLFYSAVGLAYGAVTYLFVRLFIFLTLLLTWLFVGMFVFRHAGSEQNVWPALMPHPTFASLPYETNTDALTAGESLGAFLIAFWNYLAISMLGAFAISFYFSVNTIIYYLMRREVDATELDDVYLEQAEEDFAETPVAPSVSTASANLPATTATTAPAASEETSEPAKTYDRPPPET
jgi:hypothetical protein